jgi:F0F1-type ATP synthase membrane subunit b/b'
MKNPLDSLWGTIILGLILTVILYYVVKALAGG